MIRAEISAAEARVEAENLRFRRTVLRAVEDVERSLTLYGEEELRRRELESAAAESRGAVDLARTLYDEGLADFLTVLDAERRLREADDRLASSETLVSTYLVALYKALGGGWDTDAFNAETG